MSNSETTPLVSCLMVTRDRPKLAKRAIRYFVNQTYPRCELIVVSEDQAYRRVLEDHIDHQRIDNVHVIAAEPGSTLGRLRNISLDAATGDIVCQWDDDDCYHPDRVLRQVEKMTKQGARACFFTDNLHLIKPDGQLFWIDWTQNSENDDVHLRLHPGTVMMVKDSRFRYPESGPRARMGEDLDFAADLCQEIPIAMLGGMGWLYLYVFHGANTFSKAHHYNIVSCLSVPNEWVMGRSAEIRRAMRYYQATAPVIVCGAQGPVFALP